MVMLPVLSDADHNPDQWLSIFTLSLNLGLHHNITLVIKNVKWLSSQVIADDKLTEIDTTKKDVAEPTRRDHSISNENHDEEVYTTKMNNEDIDIMSKSSFYQQIASDIGSDLVRRLRPTLLHPVR